MRHKLEVLALTVVAVLATGAALAASAQAQPKFTAAEYPVKLEGESTGISTIFNLGGTEAKCSKTTLEGGLEEATSVILISRTYSGCTMKIGGVTYSATITDNECTFRLTATEKVDEITYEAHVDIVCPVGKELEIHVFETEITHKENKPMCTYGIPPVANLTSVQLKDIEEKGKATDIEVRPNPVKGIPYERTAGTLLKCGGEFAENGTYTGSTTMIGRNQGGEKINIDVKGA
jgi:hypothetical protein